MQIGSLLASQRIPHDDVSNLNDASGCFNLARVLQEILACETEDGTGDDLLMMSPSTSVESTPESSPAMKCTRLPHVVALPPPISTAENPMMNSVPNQRSSSTKSERVKRRNREQSRKNRKKRAKVDKESKREPPPIREKPNQKYVGTSQPILTPMITSKAPVASTGYIALNRPMVEAKKQQKQQKQRKGADEKKKKDLKDYNPQELRDELGFKYHEWEGEKAIPVLGDGEDVKHVVIIMAGHPKDSEAINGRAMTCMDEARERICNPAAKSGRRGAFTTFGTGVSYGGGQTKPMNFKNVGERGTVIKELNQEPCFRRIAGFQSSVFGTWAPKLYQYYDEKLGKLFENDPTLERPFCSIFPAATYNLGPQTVCVPHLDFANLPYGYCAITAFGDYNPKTGGHIVLWECKLIIEFPPGATILIPSAIVTHSNIPVGPTERRYSFTQYAAGGLFRWVDNNFMTSANYMATLSEREKDTRLQGDKKRWEYGLSLLPTL